MQIIIPMSGFGERFRKAGYSVPKPLIEVEGKPIIAHVIDMFPGETNFIFICNEDHLNEPSYKMREILQDLCPTGKIVSIPAHKNGPIYAVLQAIDDIDLVGPVVVNYCDFTCYWDWNHFKFWVKKSACAGAVPAYKGFHPHTLGTTNYAYIKEDNGWMQDIQEKQPYTDDRMNEYASSGTYYFASGKWMVEAFLQTVTQNLHVGNEYYVSLAYKILLANKQAIAVYDLQHFMQWGTPEDVAEYENWSAIFHQLEQASSSPPQTTGTVIIPMAGLGQRFSKEGYTITKPLIPVSGKPMIVQATHDLPQAERYVFILREDMPGFETIGKLLQAEYKDAILASVPEVTEGQACTALIGLDALTQHVDEDTAGPIIFGACDNGALYDNEKLETLLKDEDIDVIVWGVRGHTNATRFPTMYGWIENQDDLIKSISVKTPLQNPNSDPIVLGTFIFKRAKDFRRCVQHMIQRECRINGEFYLDTCINDAIMLGLKCKLFEVNHYISWGTPNDLRTYEYWQSCFHKWQQHPYQLISDISLIERYKPTVPALLAAFT
jgi:NDP-sugar pyrophosphorylase family protein